ncbi:phospholipase B1, membrane-associated isoform X1 [Monomorium pharaonis]|uniref:phospholipase B1, membrane-associated isoform X1 n=1 Tax=Monomorium pharaonis TaxID=307658 RepID=UPI001746E36C|nr:phospholipase B1, membrane-associated isoform X1 [Monomorium pharaonis]XP_036147576.1 phospholipase B1, membrane-associated isoform X1 [Monomorium pharaonis]
MKVEILWLLLVIARIHPGKCNVFTEFLRIVIQGGRENIDKMGISYPVQYSGVRKQPIIPDSVPFPCNVHLGRSLSIPDNVHRLRPGDIDVIGGLGDSLVAGSGAMEEFAVGTFIEARGVSWCVGGQGNWKRFFTLPNILKVFNPKLTGYSTGTGEFISSAARLNIAFPVAATEDALQQARILVQRIKNDPKINVKKHWKLITILFGANDICSAQCYNPQQFSPSRYLLHLRRTLDFLKIALPRTLVNLIPAIDVTVSIRVTRSTTCNILHPLYCACMHKGSRPEIAASKMSRLYQQAAETLVYSGRYNQCSMHVLFNRQYLIINSLEFIVSKRNFSLSPSFRTYEMLYLYLFVLMKYVYKLNKDMILFYRYDNSADFTVVLQPFIKSFNAPNADPIRAPPIDSSLVTYDCFHFSQKGHALGANLLWNNMLEPVGNKTEKGLPKILEKVLCPTENAPYIFTNVNSRFFQMSGRQDGIVPR